MPTHQSLSGASDDDLLRRMVATHPDRFDDAFWAFFTASVAPYLPPSPTMLDLGCGPALFLRDLGERYPAATLYGYDVTQAMVTHGQQLACTGAKPIVAVLDAAIEPLPHAAGSVHLVSMSSVLHVIDEPLPVLAKIRRVLVARRDLPAQRLDSPAAGRLSRLSPRRHGRGRGGELPARLSPLPLPEQVHAGRLAVAARQGRLRHPPSGAAAAVAPDLWSPCPTAAG